MLATAARTRSSSIAGRNSSASSAAWRGHTSAPSGTLEILRVGVEPLVEELVGVEADQIGPQQLEQLCRFLGGQVPVQDDLTVVHRHHLDPVGPLGIGQE